MSDCPLRRHGLTSAFGVCVCVCVREGGREGGREGERERGREEGRDRGGMEAVHNCCLRISFMLQHGNGEAVGLSSGMSFTIVWKCHNHT